MERLPPLTPDPVIEFYKKDVDRTLLRENLKLTFEQRILKLDEMERFRCELQAAMQQTREQG